MVNARSRVAGFTLIEAMVVCAIVAALAMIAYPNMIRFSEQLKTKEGATKMAGVLGEARSRAAAEATPYLVFINPKTTDGSGNCGPAATLVRDADRSYSITAGDDVRDVEYPAGVCEKVKQVSDTTTEGIADLLLPVEDSAVRVLEVLGSGEVSNSGPGSVESDDDDEESGSGSGETTTELRVADVVVNGSTFPIDAESGRPVVAFSERGIPVDPRSPTSWGSGAGAIYLTDGHQTVYAAVVQPLGSVQLRVYDQVKGAWR